MEGEEETIDDDRYSLLNANYVLKIRRHQGSNPRPVGDVHFVSKGSANIDEAEDERTNGAMKIVSFHDVHRDRVRCSDQLLYRSMIFLREAYWVTTSLLRPRAPSIWKEPIMPFPTCVIDFNIVNIVNIVKIIIFKFNLNKQVSK